MTREHAKVAERRDLELLLELLPELGTPTITPREAPDFELRFSDGRGVGVEHARVTDPSSNADSAAMHRIVDALEAALRAAKTRLGVTVDFRSNHWEHATRRRTAEAAEKLAALCSNIAQDKLPVTISADVLEASGIAGIVELNVAQAENTFVVFGQMRNVAGALLTEHCLSVKNKKLDKYRNKNPNLDTYWLVLVVGRGFAEPKWTEGTRFLANQTNFDRVFFLDVALRTVHEFASRSA